MAVNIDAILADFAKSSSSSLNIEEATMTNTLLSRKKDIIDFLKFYSYPDDSLATHDGIKKIYDKYQTTVNELLAQLEVNIHDLDKEVLSIITDLNRIVSLLRRPETNSNHFTNANNIMYILIHVLQIKLIESYIKKIKQYRKFLRSFNQKGVFINITDTEEKSFYEYTKTEFKDLKKNFESWRKSHKRDYQFDCNTKEYFDTEEEIGLSPILEQAKALALLYEKYYSEIIGNGYGASITTKVINVLLIIVPLSLLVLSICLTCRG